MPILRANAFEFFSNSADQTRRMGIQLGGLLQRGDLVCLQGELGSGKTTLVQGITAGWGSLESVTSPSFVLVNVYKRADGAQLAHLDAYRLENYREAEELDLDQLLVQGPLVVEWADKVEAALPEERLWLKLFWIDEDRRRIEVSPSGERYGKMLESFKETVFDLA
ncbi:MAG: tRNA (adenosine(37)-N6)-threonylcarbamoyltransferase complex ATPase subunit type 1 TsaE [Anaerolineales bacterium]